MLKRRAMSAATKAGANIPERSLWQDEQRHTSALGCWRCPELGTCGALAVAAGLLSCLDLCCGIPHRCDKPCRNNPDFPLRVREIGGFSLDNVPRASVLTPPRLPLVIPMLFHGDSREGLLPSDIVALPLYKLFHRPTGLLRFESYQALCTAFRLAPGTRVVLTGTDQDPPLERWWGYEGRRREIIRGLRALGIAFATTPNFSLFVDVPRHVDLHAMKRIGLVHAEFLKEGMPTALHVNGRTETDFRRWAAYVRARPEITDIAYEFTTGTSRAARRDFHVDWLTRIAKEAGRPVGLIVRGGIDVLPKLVAIFNRVSVLETQSFMKTMKRQRAVIHSNGDLRWNSAPTPPGAPLDELLAFNMGEIRRWIEAHASVPAVPSVMAAAE
ncbi:MAG: hypothetical protein QOF94_1431 [Acidobacteriaceae bacterium]